MNPFDYVNAILKNKNQLIIDSDTEREYNPFLTNRSLSYHKDCIMYANEMNRRHHIDNKMQFDFLINIIRSQKRPFVKWAKIERNEDLECLKNIYGFSESKAKEAYRLLDKDQIQQLKEKADNGGLRK